MTPASHFVVFYDISSLFTYNFEPYLFCTQAVAVKRTVVGTSRSFPWAAVSLCWLLVLFAQKMSRGPRQHCWTRLKSWIVMPAETQGETTGSQAATQREYRLVQNVLHASYVGCQKLAGKLSAYLAVVYARPCFTKAFLLCIYPDPSQSSP